MPARIAKSFLYVTRPSIDPARSKRIADFCAAFTRNYDAIFIDPRNGHSNYAAVCLATLLRSAYSASSR